MKITALDRRLEADVRKVLGEHPGCSAAYVVEHVRGSRDRIRRALGRVGQWQTASKGRSWFLKGARLPVANEHTARVIGTGRRERTDQLSDRRAQVLRRFGWRPTWRLDDLARSLDWVGGTLGVHGVLAELADRGQVKRNEDGSWTRTGSGL